MTEPFAPSIPSGLPLRFASDAVRTRALRFERLKPRGTALMAEAPTARGAAPASKAAPATRLSAPSSTRTSSNA